ncbi:(2Fe-2S)-binding protein [Paenibacillus radicis (ex Gao et al. 2016)]|uniref:Xanthine dehydrogenase subunit E n=1 Tax=Paenibacillus radicis (ex Gao et al. 2016) TaxID=1737354 RepID=A0A917HIK1_9BACL|nr:(2Fe-2S)-binding protein [Paenibacillus radicis (ex Gao et al. 2016)]GGG79661.1 putative xanthine dehydrogenase subunit E [Paenibacillus radicis (ex Gao et al. 2016)]
MSLDQYAAPAVHLMVNGQDMTIDVAPSKRLLAILREELGLTGPKRSCEIGRCGACIVLVDGAPINACLAMAYQCAGKHITTVEGVAQEGEGELDPVQRAFLEEGGFQCGYCTPGMVITVKALLSHTPDPNEDEIEEALSGNICRCTGYGGIKRAIKQAVKWRNGY